MEIKDFIKIVYEDKSVVDNCKVVWNRKRWRMFFQLEGSDGNNETLSVGTFRVKSNNAFRNELSDLISGKHVDRVLTTDKIFSTDYDPANAKCSTSLKMDGETVLYISTDFPRDVRGLIVRKILKTLQGAVNV
jgi:hypothetical protein